MSRKMPLRWLLKFSRISKKHEIDSIYHILWMQKVFRSKLPGNESFKKWFIINFQNIIYHLGFLFFRFNFENHSKMDSSITSCWKYVHLFHFCRHICIIFQSFLIKGQCKLITHSVIFICSKSRRPNNKKSILS